MLIRNWIELHLVIGSTLLLLGLLAVGSRLAMLEMVWPLLHLQPTVLLFWAPALIFLAVLDHSRRIHGTPVRPSG